MKIALVQLAPVWENILYTQNNINDLLRTVSSGCNVLIFPELTLTGFTMNSRKFANEKDGYSIKYFSNLALSRKTAIIAGLIFRQEEHFYNSIVHFTPDGEIKSIYRKIHPFSYSGEHRHYKSGNATVSARIGEFKAGLSICYDLRFPELFRIYAKKRAEVIINIANWPFERIQHWKSLAIARAIENQCYFVGVNRTGIDKGNIYSGNRLVVDPLGNILLELDDKEQVAEFEISRMSVIQTRTKLPFLNDIKLI